MHEESTSIASVSVDLDNKWAYMKMHGVAGWEDHPSYLGLAVPRMLQFLSDRQLTVTFMLIGQDVAIVENHEPLAGIAAAGHEIGSHSFSHDTWLHRGAACEIDADLTRAEDHIAALTGQKPVGFRSPGCGLSPALLEVLVARNYRYDASAFPNMLGPLAQFYFNRTTKLDKAERERRNGIYGTFRNATSPIRPYRWSAGDDHRDCQLLEIPVTSMPGFRTPIHMTYILYLARRSSRLAQAYFRSAIRLCRLSGVQPSLLFHPTDFLGSDDEVGMPFFPGMDVTSDDKLRVLDACLQHIAQHYSVVTLGQHADALLHHKARSIPCRYIERVST